MKLAFTTLGSPDWSFSKTLNEAAAMGFSAVEIRGIEGKMRAEEIPFFFPEDKERTQAALRDRGLSLCGFGTSVSFHEADRSEEMIREGRAAIDVCRRMGIPAVRVFGDRIPSDADRRGVIDRVAAGLHELCGYAAGKDVMVLLEVHGDFNTVESVGAVIDAVKDHREFGILWDIAHSDKVYGDDFGTFYGRIRPFVRHVHIKDHHRENGAFRLCLIGQGDIPIPAIVGALGRDGYDGFLSLEWEKKWHPELAEPEVAYPAFVEYMKRLPGR